MNGVPLVCRIVTAFNRTSVELKRGHLCGGLSFNRTSVELKPKTSTEASARDMTFNRTSVELKLAYAYTSSRP